MSWRNIFKSESRKKRESDLINQLNDFLEKNYPVEANYAFGEFLDKLSKLDFKGVNIIKRMSNRKEDVIARAQKYANEKQKSFYVHQVAENSWQVDLKQYLPERPKNLIAIHPEVKMEEGADFSDRFKEKESME
jgi:hypothetical protein|tara:strand:- start:10 stop:411 length:402 start_codon:yes stop_codon:yes gene_type:complete